MLGTIVAKFQQIKFSEPIMKLPVILVPLLALFTAFGANAGLVNGGFETPSLGSTTYSIMDASFVPGWNTTASDNQIEIWSNGFNGVTSYEGTQHAELNANMVSTLYQDVSGIAAGSIVGYQFAHRGRSGIDVMRFTLTDLGSDNVLGGGDDTVLFSQLVSDDNAAWGFYSGTGIEALGHTVRFSFISVSATGGDNSFGNFLDSANFGVGIGKDVPEPGSLALIGLGLAGMAVARRRKSA